MGLFDKVTKTVEGIGKAVKAVTAPIGAAANKVANAIVNVWQGFFGSPTDPGGTNWNAYSHRELYEMLHTDASATQVGHQSTLTNTMANSAQDCAKQVQRKQENVPNYWRGDASESAKAALGSHSSGWTETSEFAQQLSTALDRAADALSRAQREMPKPIPADSITAAGAAGGAAAGSFLGPVGALAGSVLGAGASKIGASVVEANLKAEAVEVMQRYERTLRSSLDGVRTPTRTPPKLEVEIGGGNSALRGGTAPAPGGPLGSGSGAWPGATTGSGAGRSAVMPRSGGGVSNRAPAHLDPSGGSTASTIAAASAQPFIPPATGLDGRPVGSPTPWRELVGRGATPDLFGGRGAGAGAGSGSARGGAPMGGRAAAGAPGMFAAPPGAARGRQEEDAEHRYKLPHDEKLFGIDEKPPPPVIGA
jgi:hypothetical protein